MRNWRTLQPEARRMRRDPTEPEAVLWSALRDGALGAPFRRQQPIDRFIADFCCLRARLIVEVDGGAHRERTVEDAARDDQLQAAGWRVLSFANARVMNELPAVLQEIQAAMVDRS